MRRKSIPASDIAIRRMCKNTEDIKSGKKYWYGKKWVHECCGCGLMHLVEASCATSQRWTVIDGVIEQ